MSLSRGYIVLGFPGAYGDLSLEVASAGYVIAEGEKHIRHKICHFLFSFLRLWGKNSYLLALAYYATTSCTDVAPLHKPPINKVCWHLYNRGEEKLLPQNSIVIVTLLFSFNWHWFLSVPSCEGLHKLPVMKINTPQREPHPVKGNSILFPQFFCHIIFLLSKLFINIGQMLN